MGFLDYKRDFRFTIHHEEFKSSFQQYMLLLTWLKISIIIHFETKISVIIGENL